MKKFSTATASTLAITAMLAASTQADVLAFTNFDGRTASGSTASNLNWTLSGLDDPGSMTNSGPALFDNNTFNQNNFTPAQNTGNGNSFWTTDVSVTVAAGFTVTITDVTLNSISISGSGAENVPRRNDYTAFLIDPSAVEVAQVTVADTTAGSGSSPLVTLDLADTVLSAPGTYILRIKAGDFIGFNETGNHTGIDNLSINGTAVPVPEPSSLALLGLGGLLIARRRRG